MKFIHAADIHLESSSSQIRTLYGQPKISILQEVFQAFERLIDYCIEGDASFLLLSGDVFDSNWKDYSTGLFFIEQIKRFKKPVYYIKGNHDSENRLLKKLPFPENLKIFSSNAPEVFIDETLKVAIHGQSYATYHIEEDLAAGYANAIAGYFNIGLLHTSGDAQRKEEPYAPYDYRKLKTKKYDYWALGHVHNSNILSKTPYLVYSGAIQGRHFKETGPKGCYLVRVDNNFVVSSEFIELSTCLWEKLYLDVSRVSSELQLKSVALDKMRQILNGHSTEDRFILKIYLTGINRLEKPVDINKEYYINCIHCWFLESFNHIIYIQDIVDEAKICRPSLDNEETKIIWNFLNEQITQKISEEEIQELVEKERKVLLDQLPENISQQLSVDSQKYKNQIEHYLNSKIWERVSENS